MINFNKKKYIIFLHANQTRLVVDVNSSNVEAFCAGVREERSANGYVVKTATVSQTFLHLDSSLSANLNHFKTIAGSNPVRKKGNNVLREVRSKADVSQLNLPHGTNN